jgi:hypothetical protein
MISALGPQRGLRDLNAIAEPLAFDFNGRAYRPPPAAKPRAAVGKWQELREAVARWLEQEL